MSTVRFCPRCQRANPADAGFCHFDGQNLRLVLPGSLQPWELAREFIFPSGQRCFTFDEFVAACTADWASACELLRCGAFQQFFASVGRADIAQAAYDALQRTADLNEALDAFLTGLPTKEEVRAELEYTPRRLQFGRVIVGDRRTLLFRIVNKGKQPLRGKLRLEGCNWLEIQGIEASPALNASAGAISGSYPVSMPPDGIPVAEIVGGYGPRWGDRPSQLLPRRGSAGPEQDASLPAASNDTVFRLHVAKAQEVRVTVLTENLAAGQAYHTRLIVETNGGTVEVPVDVEVGAIPFAHEPFRGIADPKYLASQMRLRPKDAARLLQQGVVRQWFEQNCWIWPVAGDPAPGIAAVQQFYEALGVVKPPRLEIEPAQLQWTLSSDAQEPLARTVVYRSPDPKWVYGRITPGVSWLRVEPKAVAGPQKATFQVVLLPGELPRHGRLQAEVLVEGNGGQRLILPVTVEFPEPEVHRAVYMFLGSLVFGLAGAILRAFVAWPDLAGIEASRSWRMIGALVSEPLGMAYRWAVVLTVALIAAVWTSWNLWRRNRAWEDAFSGFFGGAMLGILAGLLTAGLLGYVEPAVARWLKHAGAGDLPRFPGIAVAWAYLFGALAGVMLACLGEPGQRVIRWLSRQYAALARRLGWKKMAAFFALRWN
ncbi:MAG: zinc ribbon domain-containing protein [Gemmatales bacterium]|nr:zinc ribbon domain-containing protein [Gemmatales bacterium]